MEHEDTLRNIEEAAILTFIAETKDGKYNIVSTNSKQLQRINIRREEIPEPVYYYSFQ